MSTGSLSFDKDVFGASCCVCVCVCVCALAILVRTYFTRMNLMLMSDYNMCLYNIYLCDNLYHVDSPPCAMSDYTRCVCTISILVLMYTTWNTLCECQTVPCVDAFGGQASGINLPSSVFASEFEEDVGMLNKAAPISGKKPAHRILVH